VKYFSNLSFQPELIGFGTYSADGGCQGFTGPIPPPFFISCQNKELVANISSLDENKEALAKIFVSASFPPKIPACLFCQ
jgi:hypothetical protein